MNDITNIEDIKKMVDIFYDKVSKDPILSPIFDKVIAGNWDHHLEKMYRFWGSMLLEQNNYYGNPLSKHIPLNLEETHFERWLLLFTQTIHENFHGEVANFALMKANNIAKVFQHRISAFKDPNFRMQ
ncbi:group III truncated hemoglobin [Halosquirtibacter laminarini]|uniref:Group III truncated hemoglobin n=1 Tax=Halosquirtibacter laminarini TaxID=3374600 RepID=A0AC61NGW5_9BACT|nr:group III truncated hemoglobin [Prolixibacteraceae bacterium]